MLPVVLAFALAAPPDPWDTRDDPDGADPRAVLESVLRHEDRARPRAPCEERILWIGDDDLRDPAPCDDDEDAAWLVAPAPGPGAPETGE